MTATLQAANRIDCYFNVNASCTYKGKPTQLKGRREERVVKSSYSYI